MAALTLWTLAADSHESQLAVLQSGGLARLVGLTRQGARSAAARMAAGALGEFGASVLLCDPRVWGERLDGVSNWTGRGAIAPLVDMLHDMLPEAEFGIESAANAAVLMRKILDAAALALQRVHRNRPGRGLALPMRGHGAVAAARRPVAALAPPRGWVEGGAGRGGEGGAAAAEQGAYSDTPPSRPAPLTPSRLVHRTRRARSATRSSLRSWRGAGCCCCLRGPLRVRCCGRPRTTSSSNRCASSRPRSGQS